MSDVIATHRLTKYYDGRPAVDGLDLRVPQGTVYGLLGRNAAGKERSAVHSDSPSDVCATRGEKAQRSLRLVVCPARVY